LEVLVESGFSNLEAIKTATVNPATFFGLEDKTGRIKNGHKADLVILNSNPLDMIRNTQDISAVIKNFKSALGMTIVAISLPSITTFLFSHIFCCILINLFLTSGI